MRALKFITGHVTYDPAYIYKFQLKTTYKMTIVYWSTFHHSNQIPYGLDPNALWCEYQHTLDSNQNLAHQLAMMCMKKVSQKAKQIFP